LRALLKNSMDNKYKKQWQEYKEAELKIVRPILSELGFELDDKQVHIGGERYITGGKKLVLLGKQKDNNKKVVIKVSRDEMRSAEIKHEWKCRQILQKINFAYHIFFTPKEILYTKKNGFTIFVTRFIDQKSTFLDRPLESQFFLSLKALEAQEGVHATTYEHTSTIKQTFGMWNSQEYIASFDKYYTNTIVQLPENIKVKKLLTKAKDFLSQNIETIDLYSDFLTHWDLVPHNFRVLENDIYLLDYSSIRFGNKYEGWARFINFMTLYNRPLEEKLVEYVKENRNEQEFLSLQLMRVFRLGELIWYYANTLDKAEGNLLQLNKKRIDLWANVLEGVLENKNIDYKIIEEYKIDRDKLRDEEEKERQQDLH
jgi:predicted Ser/Thr protein kinase